MRLQVAYEHVFSETLSKTGFHGLSKSRYLRAPRITQDKNRHCTRIVLKVLTREPG